ncbi:hypothetical protein [uncultured Aquimarina sp.]|uniref:hypothetical protein n=1 Tax=uncultured Aquimarina sp. TaxID=575652 RepID=UPI002616620B|nr:hypothetical protein [uncultured Aquimarina sp.]
MLKKYISFLILILVFNINNAQCWFTDFLKYQDEASLEFKTFAKENADSYKAYQLLYDEGLVDLGRSVDNLRTVTNNLDEIKKAGSYESWIKTVKSIFDDPDVESYVKNLTQNWSDSQKNIFEDALASSLIDKINNAIGTKLYSKYEEISYELMQWAKNKFFPNNSGWAEFAQYSGRKEYFKTWRFVIHMKQSPSLINISLGSRQAPLQSYAGNLNSTSFSDFFTRGFISVEGISNMTDPKDWLPLVGKTLKKSYDHGGKIYFHTDLITDLRALYDPNNPFFNGGTITELRYLVDNGLFDKGLIEFRLGYDQLSVSKIKELEESIDKYKKLVIENPDIGSFKDAFNIRF